MRKLLLIVFILLLTTGCGANKITFDKYERIRPGVTYFEVCAIMEEDGQEMGTSSFPLSSGKTLVTKSVVWKNRDGSNVIVTFQNDSVRTKAQFGLK